MSKTNIITYIRRSFDVIRYKYYIQLSILYEYMTFIRVINQKQHTSSNDCKSKVNVK